MNVLVFGASGYVGANLVPRLRARGFTVRAAARHAGILKARGWPEVEVVAADALILGSLTGAVEDIDVAFYPVHSMAAVDRRRPFFPRVQSRGFVLLERGTNGVQSACLG
jgi:uncharacterized protein YbjT (DUF2867 family)